MLNSQKFDWHTEKYSMGHGNYLEAKKGFELPADLVGVRNYYRGGPVTHGHWEIQFEHSYSRPIEMPAFQGYGMPGAALTPQPGSPEYEALKARIAKLEQLGAARKAS